MTETEQLLALLNQTFPDIAAMSPLDARTAVDARVQAAGGASDADSEDIEIEGAGGPLRLRVYRPNSPPQDPAVVTVYAHSGGFLHGSIASHDSFCRTWARHTGGAVVSVEVRLAPEHGAPASAEDLVTAAQWVRTSGLGDRVVLAGDSSGANAAAVAALMLRDQGGSALAGQVLIYPFLDPAMQSDSYESRGEGYFVTRRTLGFYWQNYLESSAVGPDDWRVNPANAADHRGLPPTIVVTAGLDPLCDEGRAYAQLLRGAGVPVLHRQHPDQFHGFLTIPAFAPAVAARELLWSDIRRMFPHDLESAA